MRKAGKWGKSQVQASCLKTAATSWLCLKYLVWCQVPHNYVIKELIEKLLPSLWETELESSKTLEVSAVSAWWVTRLCNFLKIIYFYGYVCLLKWEKSFIANANTNQKLTFMRFFTSFPNQKDQRKKSGCEKPELKDIYWFALTKNIRWSKSVVKNLLILLFYETNFFQRLSGWHQDQQSPIGLPWRNHI